MGTPVRLVRSDGNLIDLMTTNITLNVDRSVNPHAIPGKGGRRYAFDLNLPKALISLEGVITDTDNLPSTSAASEASAVVDFSLKSDATATEWIFLITTSDITNLPLDSATLSSPTHLHIKLTSDETVFFVKTNGTPFEGTNGDGKKYVAIYDTSTNTKRTTQQIVSSLNTLIGGMSGITSSIIDGDNPNSEGTNGALRITRVGKGSGGNSTALPIVRSANLNYGSPRIETFAGGTDTSDTVNKSAGDKVAELFAILNNTNNYTGAGRAVGILNEAKRGGDERLTGVYGDYIIGLQIPFTSKINNAESLFYLATGRNALVEDKDVANALPVGTEFDAQYGTELTYTGIKGTITQASFNQIGGEPLFSYTIQFVPVDFIL